MAASEVVFRVVVQDDGTLRVVAQNLEDLTDSTDQASDAANRLKRAQEGVGKESLNSTKAFARQAQGLGGLVSAYATVAANVFALTSAYRVLREASEFTIMKQAAADLATSTGVNLASVARDLQGITQGALGFREAMQSANLAAGAGFGTAQVAELTTVATKAANALGRNVPEAVNRMIQAVVKGEAELLDEFGIVLRVSDATKEYANSLGVAEKSLTTLQRTQAIYNSVLEQGQKRYNTVEIREEPYQKLATTINELKQETLELVNVPLTSFIRAFTENSGLLTAAIALVAAKITSLAIPALADLGTAAQNRFRELRESAKAAADAAEIAVAEIRAIEDARVQLDIFDPEETSKIVADIITQGEESFNAGGSVLNEAIQNTRNEIDGGYEQLIDLVRGYREQIEEQLERAEQLGERSIIIDFSDQPGGRPIALESDAARTAIELAEEAYASIQALNSGIAEGTTSSITTAIASLDGWFQRVRETSLTTRSLFAGAISAAMNTEGIIASWNAVNEAIAEVAEAAAESGIEISDFIQEIAAGAGAAAIAIRTITRVFTRVAIVISAAVAVFEGIQKVAEFLGLVEDSAGKAIKALDAYDKKQEDLLGTLKDTSKELKELKDSTEDLNWREVANTTIAADNALKEYISSLRELDELEGSIGTENIFQRVKNIVTGTEDSLTRGLESLRVKAKNALEETEQEFIELKFPDLQDSLGEPITKIVDKSALESAKSFKEALTITAASASSNIEYMVPLKSIWDDVVDAFVEGFEQIRRSSTGSAAVQSQAALQAEKNVVEYTKSIKQSAIQSSLAGTAYKFAESTLVELIAAAGNADFGDDAAVELGEKLGLSITNAEELVEKLKELQSEAKNILIGGIGLDTALAEVDASISVIKAQTVQFDRRQEQLDAINRLEQSRAELAVSQLQIAIKENNIKLASVKNDKDATELYMAQNKLLGARITAEQAKAALLSSNAENAKITNESELKSLRTSLELAKIKANQEDTANKLAILSSQEVKYENDKVGFLRQQEALNRKNLESEGKALALQIQDLNQKLQAQKATGEETYSIQAQLIALHAKRRANEANLKVLQNETYIQAQILAYQEKMSNLDFGTQYASAILSVREAELELLTDSISKNEAQLAVEKSRVSILQAQYTALENMLNTAIEDQLTQEQIRELQLQKANIEAEILVSRKEQRDIAIEQLELLEKEQGITKNTLDLTAAYLKEGVNKYMEDSKSIAKDIADTLISGAESVSDAFIEGIAQAGNLKDGLDALKEELRDIYLEFIKNMAKRSVMGILKESMKDIPGLTELLTGADPTQSAIANNTRLMQGDINKLLLLEQQKQNTGLGGAVSESSEIDTSSLDKAAKGQQALTQEEMLLAEKQRQTNSLALQGAGLLGSAAISLSDGSLSMQEAGMLLVQAATFLLSMKGTESVSGLGELVMGISSAVGSAFTGGIGGSAGSAAGDAFASTGQAIFDPSGMSLGFSGGSSLLPKFADGGIVTRPTNALVGEGGMPEAIIPMPSGKVPVELKQPAASADAETGGGQTINISQSFDFSNADPNSEARLRKEADRIKKETFNMVFNKINQGGKYAKISGRR